MKRSWFGLILLLALLLGSLLCSHAMVRIHQENAEKLERAAQLALEENWPGAAFWTAQARHTWDKWEFLRASLSDHNPSEEIDVLLAALEIYASAREETAFAAVCRETAKKMQAMGEAHSLKLQNIL